MTYVKEMAIPQNENEIQKLEFQNYLECLGFESQSFSPTISKIDPTISIQNPPVSEAWSTLSAQVDSCQKCPLHLERKRPVFGSGSQTAQILFVSEAPTQSEEDSQSVLNAASAELFEKMIKAMNLNSTSVYMTHAAKCRPPHNRHPEAAELENCSEHLIAQAVLLQPRLVVALGSIAAKALIDPQFDFDRHRGNFYPLWASKTANPLKSCLVLPTFHPAYLIRNPDAKRLAWEDLKKVIAHLK